MKLPDQSVNGLAVGRSLRPPEAFAKAPKKQGLTSSAFCGPCGGRQSLFSSVEGVLGKTKNRKNVSVHVERIQGQIVRAAIRRPTAVDDEMQISYLIRAIPRRIKHCA